MENMEGETCSETEKGVTFDDDGSEVNFEVEDTSDIMEVIPELIYFPPFETEDEVRLLGHVCVMAAHAFVNYCQKRNC
jgi:hypothetical protein